MLSHFFIGFCVGAAVFCDAVGIAAAAGGLRTGRCLVSHRCILPLLDFTVVSVVFYYYY